MTLVNLEGNGFGIPCGDIQYWKGIYPGNTLIIPLGNSDIYIFPQNLHFFYYFLLFHAQFWTLLDDIINRECKLSRINLNFNIAT